MNLIARLFDAWIIVAMIARAAVRVPFGIALLALAGWIVWAVSHHWMADLLAAWLVYQGGRLVFGSLASFAGDPALKDPSTRDALRRSGMLGDR